MNEITQCALTVWPWPNGHQSPKLLCYWQWAVIVSHSKTRQVAEMTKRCTPSHTCSEKITNEEINNSCKGFHCSWTACNDPAFPQMQHLLLSAHAVWLRCCLYRSTVYSSIGSRFAHATVLSTTRNSIDQLVWVPCHCYAVLCQRYSTNVWGHHSCHMQVSSILQQCSEDVLLLVEVDTQHHKLFQSAQDCQSGCSRVWSEVFQSADACQSERSHAWSELSQSADCQLVRSRVSSALHSCQAEDEHEVVQVQDEYFHLVEFPSSSLFFGIFCFLASSVLSSLTFNFAGDFTR